MQEVDLAHVSYFIQLFSNQLNKNFYVDFEYEFDRLIIKIYDSNKVSSLPHLWYRCLHLSLDCN